MVLPTKQVGARTPSKVRIHICTPHFVQEMRTLSVRAEIRRRWATKGNLQDLSTNAANLQEGRCALQLSMKLEMKDTPGQLVAALRPISDVGGNIVAVIHQHDRASHAETLGVQIVLEIDERRIPDLVSLLKENGVSIQRIGEERLLYTKTVILIGHLMHTDIADTVDRIDQTGFAEITELNIVMPAIKERSSARLMIRSVNRDDMERALSILRAVSLEKSLLLIEPLEETG